MPKGFQVACTCPHIALRHMLLDTEYFIVFLARCSSEREVVVLLWYVIHRTDYFSDYLWKISAAENTVTITLGSKQINMHGKQDDVWVCTYVTQETWRITSHPLWDWIIRLNYAGKKTLSKTPSFTILPCSTSSQTLKRTASTPLHSVFLVSAWAVLSGALLL